MRIGLFQGLVSRHRGAAGFVAGVVTVGAFATGGVALGAIPSSTTGQYTACVFKKTGAVRVIDFEAGRRCTAKERTISWSKGWRYRGAWAATSLYAVGDVVVADGSSYVAQLNSRGRVPAESPAIWGTVARGAVGATGPQGPAGASGATGPAGPAGTINGVTAGGDLTGSYPNPELKPGSVDTTNIASGTRGLALAGVTVGPAGEVETYFNRSGGAPIVTHTATGWYEIQFPGLSAWYIATPPVVTMIGTSAPGLVGASTAGGKFLVTTYNPAGTSVDHRFMLICYGASTNG